MLSYIKVYKDYIDIARELDNGARGRLFMAILQYANDEEVSDLTGGEKIAFLMMKSQIDRDRDAYEEVSEKRKTAGQKGAKKRWEQEEDIANAILPMANDSKNSKCHQDKDKEEEKDKDKDKDYIKPPKSPLKGDVFADFAGDDKVLLAALKDFAEMRKHIKAPLTDRAKQMLVNKLQREFAPEQWVPVIEQSTFKGWKDIYAIKGKDDKPPEKGSPNWVGGMPKLEKDYDAIMAAAKERAARIGKGGA